MSTETFENLDSDAFNKTVKERGESCAKSGGQWGPEEGGCFSCKKDGGTIEFDQSNQVAGTPSSEDGEDDAGNEDDSSLSPKKFILQSRKLADLKEGLSEFIFKKYPKTKKNSKEKELLEKEIEGFIQSADEYEDENKDEDEEVPARDNLEKHTEALNERFELFTTALGLSKEDVERLETEYLNTKDEQRPVSPHAAPAQEKSNSIKNKTPEEVEAAAAKEAAKKDAAAAKEAKKKDAAAAKEAKKKDAAAAKEAAKKAAAADKEAAKKAAAAERAERDATKKPKQQRAPRTKGTVSQLPRTRTVHPTVSDEARHAFLNSLSVEDFPDFGEDDIVVKKAAKVPKPKKVPIVMTTDEIEQMNKILNHLSAINTGIPKDLLSTKNTKKTQLSALKKAYTFKTGEDNTNKISKSAWAKCMKCVDPTTGKFTDEVYDCLSTPSSYDTKSCSKKAVTKPKETLATMAKEYISARYRDYKVKNNPMANEFLDALVLGKQVGPKKELAVYIKLLKQFMPNIKAAKNKEKYLKRCLSQCKNDDPNIRNLTRKDCIKSTNKEETRTKYGAQCQIQEDVINGEGKLAEPVPRSRKPKVAADAAPNQDVGDKDEGQILVDESIPSAGGKRGKRTKQKRSQKKRTRKTSFFGLF